MRRSWPILTLAPLLVGLGFLHGDGPGDERAKAVQQLAAQIDALLDEVNRPKQIEPAPLADDAEFLRRVSLDLTGRIPDVASARAFLADRDPQRRAKLIAKLVNSPHYVNHFVNYWRGAMLPEASASLQARLQAPTFEAWLRSRLRQDTGYDQLAREVLTVPVGGAGAFAPAGALMLRDGDGLTPAAFYTVNEFKPEQLAARTARLFLGVRLECAQCHHHPFADWKREQFWEYAAFFAGVQGRPGPGGVVLPPAVEQAGKHELTIPGTELVVQAKFLDGRAPNWAKTKQSRQALANWLTDPANPFFARAAVNRLWAYCFGLGLIDPIDEMVGTDAQPSHPKLLDHLARAFIRSGYDTKFLLEAITNSQAYQRSSRQTHPSQADASAFAKAALRGLSAEQLYDSLSVAIGLGNPTAPATNNPLNLGQPTGPRQEFLTRFTNLGERPTEVQTSILQALHLMNGQLVGDATSLEKSRTLAAVLEYPGFTTQQRIETLYLAALTRRPTATELGRMTQFMDAALAEVPADRRPMRQRQALADIFWALLNSSEFYLNH